MFWIAALSVEKVFCFVSLVILVIGVRDEKRRRVVDGAQ